MSIIALPMTGTKRMDYEMPPKGITLTGYIVRRMHKTRLLALMPELVAENTMEALADFGIYAAAAGTSFGPALYQPRFDGPGSIINEPDPETGAVVTVTQGERKPHYTFTYNVDLTDGSRITGIEKITGTRIGLRGLGMPAPSSFKYEHVDGSYEATAAGVINSELAPGLGNWSVRGYTELQLQDSDGNTGKIKLDRKGRLRVEVISADGRQFSSSMKLD